jgi:hypothetical protein
MDIYYLGQAISIVMLFISGILLVKYSSYDYTGSRFPAFLLFVVGLSFFLTLTELKSKRAEMKLLLNATELPKMLKIVTINSKDTIVGEFSKRGNFYLNIKDSSKIYTDKIVYEKEIN